MTNVHCGTRLRHLAVLFGVAAVTPTSPLLEAPRAKHARFRTEPIRTLIRSRYVEAQSATTPITRSIWNISEQDLREGPLRTFPHPAVNPHVIAQCLNPTDLNASSSHMPDAIRNRSRAICNSMRNAPSDRSPPHSMNTARDTKQLPLSGNNPAPGHDLHGSRPILGAMR